MSAQTGLRVGEDLPALFYAADSASLDGQRRFMKATGATLVVAVLGALTGAVASASASLEPVAIGGAVAFLIGVFVSVFLLLDRPESGWYGGRAVAESAKTLAWQYAVGGASFRNDAAGDATDRLFFNRLEAVVSGIDDPGIAAGLAGEQITPAMRTLRASERSTRQAAYEKGRIDDQLEWYASKGRWNQRRARRWRGAMLAFQAVGATSAILTASGTLDVELLGLMGAAAASVAAWLQTKDHASLAQAYAVAARELGTIKQRLHEPRDEEEWAAFVESAEQAISREHTMWLARRGAPRVTAA